MLECALRFLLSVCNSPDVKLVINIINIFKNINGL